MKNRINETMLRYFGGKMTNDHLVFPPQTQITKESLIFLDDYKSCDLIHDASLNTYKFFWFQLIEEYNCFSESLETKEYLQLMIIIGVGLLLSVTFLIGIMWKYIRKVTQNNVDAIDEPLPRKRARSLDEKKQQVLLASHIEVAEQLVNLSLTTKSSGLTSEYYSSQPQEENEKETDDDDNKNDSEEVCESYFNDYHIEDHMIVDEVEIEAFPQSPKKQFKVFCEPNNFYEQENKILNNSEVNNEIDLISNDNSDSDSDHY